MATNTKLLDPKNLAKGNYKVTKGGTTRGLFWILLGLSPTLRTMLRPGINLVNLTYSSRRVKPTMIGSLAYKLPCLKSWNKRRLNRHA